MNQIELVKRAARLTWHHKVLWFLGILIAFTGGASGGGGGGGSPSSSYNLGQRPTVDSTPFGNFDPTLIVPIIIGCCCLLLILAVVFAFVSYVARAGLYRSVSTIEDEGRAPAWREALRLGWSIRTWRMFLLDLVIGIPWTILVLVTLLPALSPLLLLLAKDKSSIWIAIVLTVLFVLVWVLLLVIVGAVMRLLLQFWHREVVLGNRSIGQALARGVSEVRSRIKDVGLFWLTMVGAGIGWGILSLIATMIVLMIAAVVAVPLGFFVYGLSHSVPFGVLAGLPIGMIILIIPLTIIQGWYTAFEGTAWTLAFREVTGSSRPAAVEPPAEPPARPAAPLGDLPPGDNC